MALNSHRKAVGIGAGDEILFFDLAEMDRLENVVLSVCEAQKHPANPVMEPGDQDAWDGAQASPWPVRTVLYDEEESVFKCWYGGCDALPERNWQMGYTVSGDGIVWEKPDLGLVEFNGSRRNNIVLPDPYGAIIKDLAEPDPARRYKLRVTNAVRTSPDGIHWTDWQRCELRGWTGPKAWDSVAFVRDDADPDPGRRFKYVFQYYDRATKPGPEQARNKALACGPDEMNITAVADNPILSPNDGFEHENHFLMLVPYKGHYLLFYECGWYHPDGTGKYGRYMADIRLAHSRDGRRFTRINPRQVVIPRGDAGDWDGQFIVISDKLVVKDDTLYIYYCGQGRDWASWPPGNAVEGLRVPPGCSSVSRMGLATLRLDGFACLETADRAGFGWATTQPLAGGKRRPRALIVNAANLRPGRDWLQVEVLDAARGEPVAGFSRNDCAPIVSPGVRIPVRWRGGELGDVKRRSVRLRFHLFGAARLHSARLA